MTAHLRLAISFLFALALLRPNAAEARVEESLHYTKGQAYRAALRYLRVEHGYNIIEKDSDSGYLLFEYPHNDGKLVSGSVEVIEREDAVAMVVQLPKLPSYHERYLIEGLLKKLRTDYGAPPAPRESSPKDAPAKKDAEADDEEKDSERTPSSKD